MSGPRVTSGADAAQDYGTPAAFLEAVIQRFGPIVFDLAAHAGNAKSPRYFAPPTLETTVDVAPDFLGMEEPEKTRAIKLLAAQGADAAEVGAAIDAIDWRRVPEKNGKRLATVVVENRDSKAQALDAFSQRWAPRAVIRHPHRVDQVMPEGLLWLNPPFSDIAPWAERCAAEGAAGARIGLLVPAAVGANWFAQHVAPHALVYLLNGRMSFDGKNSYPKDLLFALYGSGETGCRIWRWSTDTLVGGWPAWQGAVRVQLEASQRRLGSGR